MTNFVIRDELDKRLADLAAQAHLSKDEFFLNAFEEFLEDQEDYLIALTRMDRIESGVDKALSIEELREELK